MKGYVARKGERWYAVIYEGLDAATGKERRRWHPAGTSRRDAERLAASLAAEINGRDDGGRSLTFGVYLTARWLPGKKVELARSTWDGYRRKIDLHVMPSLGSIPIRRLRPHHLERLYDEKLHPQSGKRPLAPKTVLEIHLIVRGALNDAVRRGIVTRNVALEPYSQPGDVDDGQSNELTPVPVDRCLLDRFGGVGEDVEEEEDQDPCGHAAEKRSHSRARRSEATERKSQEDGEAGYRPQGDRLPGAHV